MNNTSTPQSSVKAKTLALLKNLAMDAARLVCAVLIVIFRIRRLTPEGTPYREKLRGGAIVTANHTSLVDPFIVGVTFWYRRMHFLVAEIVMGGRLRSWLLRGVGAIKVERNAIDLAAVKQCIDTLKRQRLLTVFPQGGIVKDEEYESIKSGAVFMALQADVPLIPMYICPKQHWYERRTVVIGNVIHPGDFCKKKMPSTADIQHITNRLMDEMKRCIRQKPKREAKQ